MAANFSHKQFQNPTLGLRRKDQELLPAQKKPAQPSVIALQRHIGNSGVQRLINSPSIHLNAQNTMLHRKGCGCSSCCGKAEEEPQVSRKMDGSIQRWGEEEQSEGESEGGSWFDQAVDTLGDLTGMNGVGEKVGEVVGGVQGVVNQGIDAVTGAVSDAANWVGEQWDNATGGNTGGMNNQASESGGGEGEQSNWWDEAVNTVSNWLDGEDAAQEIGGGTSWLDSLTEGVEAFFNEDEQSENENDEAGIGNASCAGTAAVGNGEASSGGVSVKGITTANFAAATAASSFTPSQITPTGKNTYDVTGTETIDYSIPTPTVSYKISPQPLSDCKQKKVDAFIAGDLGAHEKQHQDTFKNTFDGQESFSHTFKGIVAKDSAELTAKIQEEEKKLNALHVAARQTKAKNASDQLDQPPWNKPIPGIDECKD